MNIRVSIGRKMAIAFGLISVSFFAFILMTNTQLKKFSTVTSQITNVNLPSDAALNQLEVMLGNSKVLIKSWVFLDQKTDTPDKQRLVSLIETEFPHLRNNLNRLSKDWSPDDRAEINAILGTVEDSLFVKYRSIMGQLNSVESYQNPMLAFLVYPQVEDGGAVLVLLENLQARTAIICNDIGTKTKKATDEMIVSSDSLTLFIIYFGAFILLLSIVTGFAITRMLTRPLIFVKEQLLKLAEGELTEVPFQKINDEIGEIIEALRKVTGVFLSTSIFANEIGKGVYDAKFVPQGKKDVLGNALINLKNSLQKATKDAEDRREADRITNWTTNGLANFAELLRKSNNVSVLAKSIITELVTYMDINQGGVFIINEDDKNNRYLEMVACYAYGRDRFSVKRIELGEGIVGTAFLEKETVVMTEIPDGYTEITSGLGASTASSIMVVPLKTDDQILGVMELASFNDFKDFEIEFIQKIATSIATTFANVKVAEETSKLLLLSKEQTEKMKSQEDMMKQNIEELEATQEEAAFIRSQMEDQLKAAFAEIEQLKSGYVSKHIAAADDDIDNDNAML